jgi:hypothetical protein
MRQPSLLVFVSACLYRFKRRMHSPGGRTMSIPPQPNIRILNSPEYRDGYANSVQVRVSVWDFLLIFGRLQPQSTDEVEVHNFQGVYLSPQQAKALVSILQQNIHQYENAFGEIKLDANVTPPAGPIH